MEITRVELPYDVYDKLTAVQVEELKAAHFRHPIFDGYNDMPLEFEPTEEGSELFKPKHYRREYIVDLDKIETIQVKIIARLRLRPTLEQTTENRGVAFNERINVAVPGNNMMDIRLVNVHVDQCTEQIQRELECGWRILAICPQPDQRRPDYILGRV